VTAADAWPDYRSYPILYVDDDALNLKSFQALFGERFAIVTAATAEEGLEVLETKPMAVLLSDQRLGPGMPGTELCTLARERHPDVVRMIVTAYSDITTTIAGINGGQISRYITKPWKKEDMEAALRAGIDEYYLRAFTREIQGPILQTHQQTTAEVLVGRVLRQICNPTTAVHLNLVCAEGALRSLDPLMQALPPPFAATFAELRDMIRDASSALSEIVGQIDRMRDGELLPGTGGGSGEAEANVDRILRAALTPLRAEITRRAWLVLELGAAPRVAMSPSHVSQIVLNLLPTVVAACDPDRASQNQVVIGSFVTEGVPARGGFFMRYPKPAAGADPTPAWGGPVRRGDPNGTALLVVRELVEGAGGQLKIIAHGSGQRELRVELPLLI
jgi:two-component system NtrC family sensor kinase